MPENEAIYKPSRFNSITISIVFLILVILLTLGLYLYNSSLVSSNIDFQKEIEQRQNSINEKKKDKSVQAYDLYTLNKNAIDRLEVYSKIYLFTRHLSYISLKYRLDIKGFSYSNGKLQAAVSSITDDSMLDFQKTAEFIKNYRQDQEALFNLDFVKQITTVEDREKFNISLDIKL